MYFKKIFNETISYFIEPSRSLCEVKGTTLDQEVRGMLENSRINGLIERLLELITALSENEFPGKLLEELLAIYWQFMQTVHRDLVMQEDQGAVLATASCIPIWEMLHLYSGSLGPLYGKRKAFVVTLLTGLYPKMRDRRCLYQHPGCMGYPGFPCVSLSCRLPVKMEVFDDLKSNNTEADLYSKIVLYVRNTLGAEENILSSPPFGDLKENMRILTEDILPHCYIVQETTDSTSGAMLDRSAILISLSEATSSLRSYDVFCQTIWKYLILSQVYLPEDRRTLSTYLINSQWSQRKVRLLNQVELTYANLLNPMVHESAVCISVMPAVISEASDNTPLVHPGHLDMLLPKETVPLKDDMYELLGVLTENFIPERVIKHSVTLAHATASSVKELLVESIPQEVAFSEEGSSCRDCDKLTQICRSVVLSPIVGDGKKEGISLPLMNRILFDRKRTRDDNVYEGPTLLPVTSTLSEVLNDKAVKSLSTLERIATTN